MTTIIDGDISSTITLAINADGSDNNFDSLDNQTLSVLTTNDDSAGFTIAESDLTTVVTETGSTDTFTVVLDAEPNSDVVIDLSTPDATEATVSLTSLTFTPTDWNTPQTVSVTGVNDTIIDGDISSTITLAINADGSDDNFDTVLNQILSVLTTNDDSAGFTIAESDSTTVVTETGSTDTFTVVLDAEPDSDVVIDLSTSDSTESSVSPSTLTFTSANWNTPQTVSVTGVNDSIIDGDVDSLITLAINDASSDDNFDSLDNKTVSVSTTNDDSAGFTVVESDLTTVVTEYGSTDTFTVKLNAEPDSDVVIDLSTSDSTEATVSLTSLTFTPTNWNTPQTVTVTGVNDDIIDINISSTIILAINANNSDDNFDSLDNQTVSVTTTDDDSAGFTVAESDSTTVVSESGSTDTFTVVLNTEPNSDVVIDLTSSDETEATVSLTSLTFTPNNWNTPQTVTVTGVNDNIIDINISSTIILAINANNSDDNFDSLDNQTVSVTTTNDDFDNDNDGYLNANDAFPNDASAYLDSDSDGYPDSLNNATQLGNGYPVDQFPNDASAYLDSDSDGYPDSFLNNATQLSDGTTVDLDDDNDGFLDTIEETHGSSPIDETSVPSIDFSDTIDIQIGAASGLDSIEPNVSMWFDASNIDFLNNSSLSDGDSIHTWLDLSGNNHSAIQESNAQQPIYNSNYLAFDGTNDYFAISNKFYQTDSLDNIHIFAVVQSSSNKQQIILSYDRNEYYHLSLHDDASTGFAFDTSSTTTDDLGSETYISGQTNIIHGSYEKIEPATKKVFIWMEN